MKQESPKMSQRPKIELNKHHYMGYPIDRQCLSTHARTSRDVHVEHDANQGIQVFDQS